ncbi:unnamed protein product [Leptosia nina]|uniref:Spaetzle domain-containing protein n=1 Tax=Leptosia nina TaxID=320188 RepID=A0AAV1JAN5_9NEOP
MALKEISGAELTKVEPQNVKDGEVLYEVRFGKNIQLTIPEECYSTGICEEIPDFPEEEVNDIINKMMIDKVHFNYDPDFLEPHTVINEAYKLCSSRRVYLRPKAVRDSNYQWYLVLNSNYTTAQRFKGEQCLGPPETSCVNVGGYCRGFHGECVQKYYNRYVLVLSSDLKQVLRKIVAWPLCCACAVFR